MISAGPAGLVRRWVRIYTSGLPAELRDGRRHEIDGDLWSQFEEAAALRRSPASINAEVLARWLAGIPADLSWRFEHRGERAMTSSHPRVAVAGSGGLGLTIALGSVLLALTFVLFAITSQLTQPADPYYVSGVGVWLVLGGSGAELLLAAGMFGFAMRYVDLLPRIVAAAIAIGGLLTAIVAVGAFRLIAVLPIGTAVLAWSLVSLGVIGRWLAVVHAGAGVVFVAVIFATMGIAQGSPISPLVGVIVLWPATLAGVGIALIRADRAPREAIA